MMNKPPYGFDEFKPIMEKYFIKNYPFFIQNWKTLVKDVMKIKNTHLVYRYSL